MSSRSAPSPSSISSRLRNSFQRPRLTASSFIEKAKRLKPTQNAAAAELRLNGLPEWTQADDFKLEQKLNAQIFYPRGAQTVFLCKVLKLSSRSHNGQGQYKPQILAITMAENSTDWATLAVHRIKVNSSTGLAMDLRSSFPLQHLAALHAIQPTHDSREALPQLASLNGCIVHLIFSTGSELQVQCIQESDTDLLVMSLHRIMHQFVHSAFSVKVPLDIRKLQADVELNHAVDRRCHVFRAVAGEHSMYNLFPPADSTKGNLGRAQTQLGGKSRVGGPVTDHHSLLSMSRSEQRRVKRMVNEQGWSEADATALPKLVADRIKQLESKLEEELMAWEGNPNKGGWFESTKHSKDPVDELVAQLEQVETELDRLDTWMSKYSAELTGMRSGIEKIEKESNALQLESINHARLRDSIEDLLDRYSVNTVTKQYLNSLQENLQGVQAAVELGSHVPEGSSHPTALLLDASRTLRLARSGRKVAGDSQSVVDSDTDAEGSDSESASEVKTTRRRSGSKWGGLTSDEESADETDTDASVASESFPEPAAGTRPPERRVGTGALRSVPIALEHGMLSVQEKQQETQDLLYSFGSHLDMFLENRIHANAITMTEAVSVRVDTDLPVIDSFQPIHDTLIGYAPLVREIRAIEVSQFDQVRMSYIHDMGRVYAVNLKEFFGQIIGMVTDVGQFDSRLSTMSECSMTSFVVEKEHAVAAVRRVLEQREECTGKNGTGTDLMPPSPKLSPAMALKYALAQLVPLIAREKEFIHHFFYMKDDDGSGEPDSASAVNAMLDEIFLRNCDCINRLGRFVKSVRTLSNNFEILNMVVEVETVVKLRNEDPNDFVVSMLADPDYGLQASIQIAFESFIDEQIRWLDGLRPDVRYCGVLRPVLKFPAFIDHIVAVWEACVPSPNLSTADGTDESHLAFSAGNNAVLALQKVSAKLLHWIHRTAATKPKYTAIVLMENLYFFEHTVRARHVHALEAGVVQASRGYVQARDAYLGWMLSEVFPSLVTFLYEADEILLSIAKSDLIYHKPKEDYKRTAEKLTRTSVAAGTAAMRKRVDKHFGSQVNLGPVVLEALHDTLVVHYDHFHDLAMNSYGEHLGLDSEVFSQLCLRGLGMME